MVKTNKQNFLTALNRIISSNWFYLLLLLLFFIQVLFYAASIRYGVPPDERYHFTFIKTYAENPILSGPVINNQPETASLLGDVTRSPNYLYHFIMSLPLRVMSLIGFGFDMQIFFLRLLNGLMAVSSLVFLRKILRSLKISDNVSNITILSMSSVGMFVWLSSSINYDNLAIFLSLVYLWILIKLVKRPSMSLVVNLISVAGALLLIKTASLLFIFIVTPLILIKFIDHEKTDGIKNLIKNTKKDVADVSRRSALILAAVIFLSVGILIIERVGKNLIQYGSIGVSCEKLQPVEVCDKNPVYRRNAELRNNYENFVKENGKPTQNPFLFLGDWTYLMYERVFYYTGHKRMQPKHTSSNIAIISLLIVLLGVVLAGIRKTKEGYFETIIASSVLYILAVALYNLNTLNNVGEKLGFQGRYLIIGLPFLIAGTLVSVFQINKSKSIKFIITCALLIFVFTHHPLVLFFKNTDATWYSQPINKILKQNDSTPVPEL